MPWVKDFVYDLIDALLTRGWASYETHSFVQQKADEQRSQQEQKLVQRRDGTQQRQPWSGYMAGRLDGRWHVGWTPWRWRW
eukprot:4059619-Prymnesium_polylepis.2